MSMQTSAGWVTKAWKWTVERTQAQAAVIQDHFPHVAENGRYDRCEAQWWTAGFWPGLLWLVQQESAGASSQNGYNSADSASSAEIKHSSAEEASFKQLVDWAQSCERQLEQCLRDPQQIDHDLGFIWLLSGVADYKQTGNADSRRRSLLAANLLAARFNVKGNYIRAWNFDSPLMDTRGVAIIDSMMNLPLLYWASLETRDPRYHELAVEHADTIAREFVRDDHSICHVVEFDPKTGQKLREHGGQGYEPGSAWARGTAWAIYGFALSYAYTGDIRYLDISRQTARFFLKQLGENIVPCWDFRAPAEHQSALDSSATAIAASGLLELAGYVPGVEQDEFRQAAAGLTEGLYTQYSTRETGGEGLITHGTVHYPEQRHLNVPIIYGDYFFAEALCKLQGRHGLFTPGLNDNLTLT